MQNISKHISWSESTYSATAVKLGISNIPNSQQVECMQELANNVFEPLRAHFGKPIRVTSFFRSALLNKAVGGSSTSQHLRGEAMDIKATLGLTNKEMFEFIKNNLEFDQLIWEFGSANEPDWVHVSYSKGKNRKQILRAIKENGKTKYFKLQ